MQFDIRFYVVALLFIIFDVEVAFFFPWATVFGKANTLADPNFGSQQVANMSSRDQMSKILLSDPNAATVTPQAAHQLMGIALLDLIVFFAVVLSDLPTFGGVVILIGCGHSPTSENRSWHTKVS